jgi:metallophosphoesterase superfamily enzyme
VAAAAVPRAGPARLDGAVAERIRALSDRVDWIWIHGNHDPLPPKQLGGRGAVEIAIGPLVFRHDAHREQPAGGGEVIGHYHPVASVSTRGRSFRRRCFAIGRDRLLLPAFGAYAGGLNVREAAIRSLLDSAARVALLGRDRLHLFPLAAVLPDATLPPFELLR